MLLILYKLYNFNWSRNEYRGLNWAPNFRNPSLKNLCRFPFRKVFFDSRKKKFLKVAKLRLSDPNSFSLTTYFVLCSLRGTIEMHHLCLLSFFFFLCGYILCFHYDLYNISYLSPTFGLISSICFDSHWKQQVPPHNGQCHRESACLLASGRVPSMLLFIIILRARWVDGCVFVVYSSWVRRSQVTENGVP